MSQMTENTSPACFFVCYKSRFVLNYNELVKTGNGEVCHIQLYTENGDRIHFQM